MEGNSMKRWIAVAMLAALATAPACKGEKSGDETAEEGGKSDGKSGLNHPDNDADVVKMAKAALKCEWKSSSLDYKCKDFKAWNESDKFKDGAQDKTLLNMLEDGDKSVRFLACKAMQSSTSKWSKDKAAGKRILAAAKKEKDKHVGDLVGRLTGRLDLGKTGLDADVKKLLAESKSPAVRKGIVGSVLFNNRKAGDFYELLQKMAREEKDKEVRKAAAAAFWTGGSKRKDDTCNLWLELAGDADGDIAGHSAYHCSWWSSGGGCTGQWDKLLDTIEGRGKKGDISSTFMTSGLGWLQQQPKASTAQKDRALAIAEAIVANKANDKSVRSDALRLVGEYSPKASTVAAKYKADDEFFVKSTAERILSGKVKKKKRK
jgi:hypothetical protein